MGIKASKEINLWNWNEYGKFTKKSLAALIAELLDGSGNLYDFQKWLSCIN